MASDKIVAFSSGSWTDQVEKSAKPVVVDFWATWCGPCRMIAPIVEELAGEYGDAVKIGKLNVDENQDVAAKYGVMSIPTLLVFKAGQPVERIVGFQQKRELKAKIDHAIG